MSHLYGTGEITIAWQFAFCLVGNLFREAKTKSIENIAGGELLHEAYYFMLETSLFIHLVLKAAELKHY